MLMKKVLFAFAFVAALAACDKTAVPTWTNPEQQVNPDGTAYDVKVAPVITKVTETKFENGDAVGITITRESGVWAENAKLVFNGAEFSGSLKWYPEGTDKASVVAYYPYADEVPTSFTVASDQRSGSSASDLVAGALDEAYPSAEAIVVPFQHKLSLIVFNVVKNVEGELVGITLDGAKLKANLAADFTAAADEQAAPGSVKAYKANATRYALILPPQTVALTAKAETAGGNILSQVCKEVTLEGGKKYNITLVVNPGNLLVVLPGDVEDWTNGGDIPGEDEEEPEEVQFSENLADGYFTYDNVKYNVVKMQEYGNENGRWWMAQNLAYLPKGYVPCSESDKELTPVDAGIYAPLVKGDGVLVFSTEANVIARQGYLYQSEVALGLKVGDITSEDQAKALEGTQGICPNGWHIPTLTEYVNLIGYLAGYSANNTSAPYCKDGKGSLELLNEDGFNLTPFGAVSIQNNAATTVSQFMGYNANMDDPFSSWLTSSSWAATATNNFQFWGLMPMSTLKTCSGSKMSYRIAAPVRCIRNVE